MKQIKAFSFILVIGLCQSAAAQPISLSLAECKRLSLEQNKKIIAAQMQINAAKTANEGAKLNNRPSFDASAMLINLGKPINTILPDVLVSTGLDVKQPVYTGGKIKLGIQASAKAIEIYEAQKTLTASEVLVSVENAYWQVVQVREKIVLANKYKEMLEGLQKDLKNAVDAGLIYKNDLLRVEVSLNEAELRITMANDNMVVARLNLAQIIGQPGKTDFAIADSATGDFNELSAAAFEVEEKAASRPEINLLKKAIEAEQIQTNIIRANLKPNAGIAVSGIGAFGNNVNFGNGNNSMITYYALASVSVPIFDWGKNAKKIQEQIFKIQARQVQLDETKEFVNLEIQNAYLQLNQSVKKIGLAKLSLQQSDENLRLANDRYKAGTITGKDVLEAQAIWQQAYTNIIDAKVGYRINEAGYKKAIGGLN